MKLLADGLADALSKKPKVLISDTWLPRPIPENAAFVRGSHVETSIGKRGSTSGHGKSG